MNERPEDDPSADTGMFRAYVEHGDGADTSTSRGVPVGILRFGRWLALACVVVVLILLLI